MQSALLFSTSDNIIVTITLELATAFVFQPQDFRKEKQEKNTNESNALPESAPLICLAQSHTSPQRQTEPYPSTTTCLLPKLPLLLL